jgi:hypothetical protein
MSKKLSESSLELINNTLSREYQTLIHTLSVFFQYITLDRDGYINVNKENVKARLIAKPKLTDVMVKYVIQHILGIIVMKKPQDIYVNIKDHIPRTFENDIEIDFADSLPKHTQKIISSIYKNDDVELVSPIAIKEIHSYLDFLFNTFVANTEFDESLIVDNIEGWKHRQGDNTFVPIDYGFMENDSNVLLQSFIYVLCGLCDWLEKDTIVLDDIISACQILFYRHSEELEKLNIKVKKTNAEYITIIDHVSLALYKNDFYVSETAMTTLCSIFYNLLRVKDQDVIDQLLIYSKQI